jgi:hypothetical protein
MCKLNKHVLLLQHRLGWDSNQFLPDLIQCFCSNTSDYLPDSGFKFLQTSSFSGMFLTSHCSYQNPSIHLCVHATRKTLTECSRSFIMGESTIHWPTPNCYDYTKLHTLSIKTHNVPVFLCKFIRWKIFQTKAAGKYEQNFTPNIVVFQIYSAMPYLWNRLRDY